MLVKAPEGFSSGTVNGTKVVADSAGLCDVPTDVAVYLMASHGFTDPNALSNEVPATVHADPMAVAMFQKELNAANDEIATLTGQLADANLSLKEALANVASANLQYQTAQESVNGLVAANTALEAQLATLTEKLSAEADTEAKLVADEAANPALPKFSTMAIADLKTFCEANALVIELDSIVGIAAKRSAVEAAFVLRQA